MKNSSPTSHLSTKPPSNFKAKLLSSYYGHPIKDMKLIIVAGESGKTAVAHFIHEMLGVASQRVAVLASEYDIKLGILHKFFSDAWKANADYVVVTASPYSILKNTFSHLPIHLLVLTDLTTENHPKQTSKNRPTPSPTNPAELPLLQANPKHLILNHDDPAYYLAEPFTSDHTLTYGKTSTANLQIETSKLYKKGSEAKVRLNDTRFTIASFLATPDAVTAMAAATAAGHLLHLSTDTIIDGLANYQP